jgi:hypothetical protein
VNGAGSGAEKENENNSKKLLKNLDISNIFRTFATKFLLNASG